MIPPNKAIRSCAYAWHVSPLVESIEQAGEKRATLAIDRSLSAPQRPWGDQTRAKTCIGCNARLAAHTKIGKLLGLPRIELCARHRLSQA